MALPNFASVYFCHIEIFQYWQFHGCQILKSVLRILWKGRKNNKIWAHVHNFEWNYAQFEKKSKSCQPFSTYQQLKLLQWRKSYIQLPVFQNPSSRSRIFLFSLVYVCIYLLICVFICVMPPSQRKNDTEPKFGTHSPLGLI